MKTNDEIKSFHRALVLKAAKKCELVGNRQLAVRIGNAIVSYGQKWVEGLADDGKYDDREVGRICESFDALVDEWIPEKSFSPVNPVSWIYNLLKGKLAKLIGITWCLAAALALTGCVEGKASHQNGIVLYGSTSGRFGIGYGETEDLPAGCTYYRRVETSTVTGEGFLSGPASNTTTSITRWDTTKAVPQAKED